MYSIADYGAMIADRVRMDAFVRALRAAVAPGSVVVDIGTGTGIFALLACRFGARRVYAIEPDDTIHVAKEIAAANGCADRIEFIQALSTDVSLPERADVIVADIGGVLPWFRRHIPSIADARRRFLAPGGRIVPQRDTAWAAPVEAPDLYARHTGPWRDNPFGFDMEAARRLLVNSWRKGRVAAERLLAEPRPWATLDYGAVEDPDVRARVAWDAGRPATGHGLLAGFDRTVFEDIHLSNAPTAPEAIRPPEIYGTIFFPWPAPIDLACGDRILVELDARLVGDDYVWSWKTQVRAAGGAGAEKAAFEQSTFLGAPLSPDRLRKRAGGYRPTLTEEGRLARLVLESMDAGATVGEIADRVSAGFPARFPRVQDALSYVGDLAGKYG